jgi:hypothetical protein
MPLDEPSMRLALQPFLFPGWEVADDKGGVAKVRMTQEAADRIVDLSKGEPYLFQVLGANAWRAGITSLIDIADVETGWLRSKTYANAHVENILERLPKRERDLLEAMAKLPTPDRTATNIAHAMGLKDASELGPTAARLDTRRGIVERGKPYGFRHRAVEAYLTSDWP